MLSRILLVGGLGVAAAQLLPALPKEHTLVVVFGTGQSENIRRVDLAWRGAGAVEPRGGVTHYYGNSGAPRELNQRVYAPSGAYVLHVLIEREGALSRSVELERRVRLEGEDIRVLIEGALK